MSTDKRQGHPPIEQLQLFESLLTATGAIASLTLATSQGAIRPGLRLVVKSSNIQSAPASDQHNDLSVIEARLIGRTKFF
jgi:hypothetical protein